MSTVVKTKPEEVVPLQKPQEDSQDSNATPADTLTTTHSHCITSHHQERPNIPVSRLTNTELFNAVIRG
ncbi:Hypp2839 [Branchiostoma lanceolatum]|uniref:Hypp2839 protein n=1 Tax=Branchiostoma lanceolatum TaxID=7740 RepID=A0A8J9ZY09_BRALA|nr:Hypp2839 [Branchiostoma lanceolatum]